RRPTNTRRARARPSWWRASWRTATRRSLPPASTGTASCGWAASCCWPNAWRCATARSPTRSWRCRCERTELAMNDRVALSLGDPNGVGPEIVLKALAELSPAERERLVVYGPGDVLHTTAQ